MRGVGTQRPNKAKVTFCNKDEVVTLHSWEQTGVALPEDPQETASTGKRGRPCKPVEALTRLEQAEKSNCEQPQLNKQTRRNPLYSQRPKKGLLTLLNYTCVMFCNLFQ